MSELISYGIGYTPDSTASTTLVIQPPPIYAAGNTLVMGVIAANSTGGVAASTPTGWTAVSSGGATLALFTKTASSNETPETVTLGSSCISSGFIAAYPASTVVTSSFANSSSNVVTYTPTFPGGVTANETVLMLSGIVDNSLASGDFLTDFDNLSANINLPSTWTTDVPVIGPILVNFTPSSDGSALPVALGLAEIQGSTSNPTITSPTGGVIYNGFLVLSVTGPAPEPYEVTAVNYGSTASSGMALTVKALTGTKTVADIIAGGATQTFFANGVSSAPQKAITPNATGSMIFGAATENIGVTSSSTFTPNSSTTFHQNVADLLNVGIYGTFEYGVTTAGVPVTLGGSAPDNTNAVVALAEILQAPGKTITEVATATINATSPAQYNTIVAQQTAVFPVNPPAGILLVAIVSCNSNYAQGSVNVPDVASGTNANVAITDTMGLVWTQLSSVAYPAYAGIWIAQVPNLADVPTINPGPNWLRQFKHTIPKPHIRVEGPNAPTVVYEPSMYNPVYGSTYGGPTVYVQAYFGNVIIGTDIPKIQPGPTWMRQYKHKQFMPSVNKAVGGNVNVTGLVGQVNVVANFGTITVTRSGLVAQDSVAANFGTVKVSTAETVSAVNVAAYLGNLVIGTSTERIYPGTTWLRRFKPGYPVHPPLIETRNVNIAGTTATVNVAANFGSIADTQLELVSTVSVVANLGSIVIGTSIEKVYPGPTWLRRYKPGFPARPTLIETKNVSIPGLTAQDSIAAHFGSLSENLTGLVSQVNVVAHFGTVISGSGISCPTATVNVVAHDGTLSITQLELISQVTVAPHDGTTKNSVPGIVSNVNVASSASTIVNIPGIVATVNVAAHLGNLVIGRSEPKILPGPTWMRNFKPGVPARPPRIVTRNVAIVGLTATVNSAAYFGSMSTNAHGLVGHVNAAASFGFVFTGSFTAKVQVDASYGNVTISPSETSNVAVASHFGSLSVHKSVPQSQVNVASYVTSGVSVPTARVVVAAHFGTTVVSSSITKNVAVAAYFGGHAANITTGPATDVVASVVGHPTVTRSGNVSAVTVASTVHAKVTITGITSGVSSQANFGTVKVSKSITPAGVTVVAQREGTDVGAPQAQVSVHAYFGTIVVSSTATGKVVVISNIGIGGTSSAIGHLLRNYPKPHIYQQNKGNLIKLIDGRIYKGKN